ncbi:MAG: metal ABC transporter permease [Ruminococcus sp.]|uniref:metal ABC transporter permease n=1 Tax=Ruminococcus sp. TaxID=41978 RepID=UPI0025D9EE6C|nr:metal ABC transporter permease [Ruminococcus sp.]MBQ6034833.1 metal ABC transporter permease [Ruminococcus sp.]MBQ9543246.1 metal ABC transporter permease [Ruminococcus sp.]MBR0528769.1 metal ABC transporter permease [Ruminococcus sp.]
MSEQLEILQHYFSYPFVKYAMIVGLLIALCSSLLGVTLVLKRFSFIGDGLSHVAFGAMAVSTVLSVSLKRVSHGESLFAKFLEDTNGMVIILPVTLIAAVLLLRTGQNTKIKGDAAIAMISVGSLAVGYMLINVYSASANVAGDVCSTLFGSTSILTLTEGEVWLCAALAVVVLAVFVIFYNRIFSVTFDESFAKASGVKANGYNLLIAIITALIIVLAMNLVGSLLISALIIFPALSAMRLFKSFLSVIICSAVISVICAGVGIIVSILFSTPAGSTIVSADIIVFFGFSAVSAITRRN